MRIKQVQLLVTAGDLSPWLMDFLPEGKVTDLRLTTDHGVMDIACRYRVGPISIPVEMFLQVVGVTPSTLDLTVQIQGASQPQEKVLAALRTSLPKGLRVSGSRIQVDLGALASQFKLRFKLQAVSFTREGIHLSVTDLVLPVWLLSRPK